MTKKTENTELAIQQNAGLQVAADWMTTDFGQGMEGADVESFAIPFLSVLQKMSPIVDEDDAAHIKGAKAGMLINTVTKQLIDGKVGVEIVPCAYRRSFILWGSRETSESGFKGEFTPEQVEEMRNNGTIVEIGGRLYKPDEDGKVNEKKADRYVDTRTHYVLVIDPETGVATQAIMALASSQVKKSKVLLTMLSQRKVSHGNVKVTPPTFANKVRVTTIGESNEQGSWSGVNFTMGDLITDRDLYMEAKAFHDAVVRGEAKADHGKAAEATGEAKAEVEQDDKF